MPASADRILTTHVAIAVWRAKLVRTRASKFASFGSNLPISRLVIGHAGIADEETYPVLQVSVFEKSDSISHNLPAHLRAKPARRHTGLLAEICRQMRLIGIT